MVIYLTTNLITGKQYVGQTTRDNKYYFGSGLLIQKAIEKYGKENFKKETLIECSSKEELDEQEIFWIKKLNTLQPDGYNIQFGGNNGSGYSLSEEARKNISEGHKDKKHSEETKRKIGIAHRGKIVSLETKEKISLSLLGKNHPMYGKHFSEEHRRKLSESQKGKIVSEETKKKISNANKGSIPWNKGQTNIYRNETKEKMRRKAIGRKHSEETKRKISEAHKGMNKP